MMAMRYDSRAPHQTSILSLSLLLSAGLSARAPSLDFLSSLQSRPDFTTLPRPPSSSSPPPPPRHSSVTQRNVRLREIVPTALRQLVFIPGVSHDNPPQLTRHSLSLNSTRG